MKHVARRVLSAATRRASSSSRLQRQKASGEVPRTTAVRGQLTFQERVQFGHGGTLASWHQDAFAGQLATADRAFTRPPLERRNPRQGEGFASTATEIRTPVSAVRGHYCVPSPTSMCRAGRESGHSWERRGATGVRAVYVCGTSRRAITATLAAAPMVPSAGPESVRSPTGEPAAARPACLAHASGGARSRLPRRPTGSPPGT